MLLVSSIDINGEMSMPFDAGKRSVNALLISSLSGSKTRSIVLSVTTAFSEEKNKERKRRGRNPAAN